MFEERKGTLVRVHKMPEDLLRCEFVHGPVAKFFGNCAYRKYHPVRIAPESTTSQSIFCARVPPKKSPITLLHSAEKQAWKNQTEFLVGTTVNYALHATCGNLRRFSQT